MYYVDNNNNVFVLLYHLFNLNNGSATNHQVVDSVDHGVHVHVVTHLHFHDVM